MNRRTFNQFAVSSLSLPILPNINFNNNEKYFGEIVPKLFNIVEYNDKKHPHEVHLSDTDYVMIPTFTIKAVSQQESQGFIKEVEKNCFEHIICTS
mgnify:CR=1 FL=1